MDMETLKQAKKLDGEIETIKRWQRERSVLQSYKSDLPEDNRVVEKYGDKVYICDHEKNTQCKKTGCGYLGRGECFHTTNKEFEKEGDIYGYGDVKAGKEA